MACPVCAEEILATVGGWEGVVPRPRPPAPPAAAAALHLAGQDFHNQLALLGGAGQGRFVNKDYTEIALEIRVERVDIIPYPFRCKLLN